MTPEDLLRELRDPQHWDALRTPRSGRGELPAGPRARFLPAIAALVIAVFAVTGIGVGFGSLHKDGAPAATDTATASTTVTLQAFTGVTPGTTRTYSSSSPPPECTHEQLQVSTGTGGGAAGTFFVPIYLHNGGAACEIDRGTVRVGGTVTRLATGTKSVGVLLPPGAVLQLAIGAAEVCGGDGSVFNIDPAKLVLPIALHFADGSFATGARYPQTRCAAPYVDPELRNDMASEFSTPLRPLTATVVTPTSTPPGRLDYEVTLQNTGSKALVLTACPTGDEVLTSDGGLVVVRGFTVQCRIGATVQADEQQVLSVSTTIPSIGMWDVQWYLVGGGATTAASTTCPADRLTLSEPAPTDANTANYIQPVRIVNAGSACTLPVTAFSVSGWTTSAPAGDPNTLDIPTGASTVLVQAPVVCPDGSANVDASDTRLWKPIVLSLAGGEDLQGLDRPFPQLHCAGPVAYRLR